MAVAAVTGPAELAVLWERDLAPFFRQACQMLQAGTSRHENAPRKAWGGMTMPAGTG